MNDSWDETSDDFKSMMIGKLLGDGCITQQKGRKPRFQFIHMDTDYEWSKYCYDHLCTFIPLNPPKYKCVTDPRLTKGYSLSYYVQSRTSNIITYLRTEWYPEDNKIVPYDLIEKYFNEISLAWWYMDDGHLKQKGNIPEKVILSTESFTIQEIKWIIEFLHKKYQLNFSSDKQNRIILYDQFQIHYFLYLVMPFLHHSMNRKTLHFSKFKIAIASRRTTVYLPASVTLDTPTKNINDLLTYLSTIINQYKQGAFYKTYHCELFVNKISERNKSYQIVIDNQNLANLLLLKDLTGLTFSKLVELCFSHMK